MLADTLRAAERAGDRDAADRAAAYDIDTIEDLRRLERDLATAAPEVAPRVRQWFVRSVLTDRVGLMIQLVRAGRSIGQRAAAVGLSTCTCLTSHPDGSRLCRGGRLPR